MLRRIVKMTFAEGKAAVFMKTFHLKKERIRAAVGCRHMELLQDKSNPNILFTLSDWDSEEALNNYRESPLFRETWLVVKQLFGDKPQAWSLEILDKPNDSE